MTSRPAARARKASTVAPALLLTTVAASGPVTHNAAPPAPSAPRGARRRGHAPAWARRAARAPGRRRPAAADDGHQTPRIAPSLSQVTRHRTDRLALGFGSVHSNRIPNP